MVSHGRKQLRYVGIGILRIPKALGPALRHGEILTYTGRGRKGEASSSVIGTDFRGVDGAPGTACPDLSQETLLRPLTKAALVGTLESLPQERERNVFTSESSFYPKWRQNLSLPIRNDKILLRPV